MQTFENQFVFLFEPEGLGGVKNVSNIALPSVVTIKVEHVEEIFTVFDGKDGILRDDLFGKNHLPFLLSKLFTIDNHFIVKNPRTIEN